MSLLVGQIVRYGDGLWRVDMVNDCRARITPLSKRHVVLGDREFDAERGGVNISPNSPLDIVTDLEQERDRIELRAAERELAEAKAEMAREASVKAELADAERELVEARTALAEQPTQPSRAGGTGGWRLTGRPSPTFRPGSLAAGVIAYIQANPGLDTKTLTSVVKGQGNVAACVSRFHQAGLIEKS